MTARRCIEKLHEAGQISRRVADHALALEGGLQVRFGQHVGPTSAEGAAAAETARALAASVAEKKLAVAKQAIAYARATERQQAHPKGPVAGLMSLLTRDIWEHGGGINVSAHTEVIEAQLFRFFNAGMEAYRSRAAGLRQDLAGARNMVREIFGEDTGDEVAKAAAEGWKRATEAAVERARAAGRVFSPLDDWRLPQFWQPERLRPGMFRGDRKAEWLADVRAEIDNGGLVLWDKSTYQPASPLQRETILEAAYQNITTGGGFGGGGSFSAEVRVFRFQNADSYFRLMGKYGPGSDVFSLLTGHLRDSAREIALSEVLGPQHGTTFRALLEAARSSEGNLSTAQRLKPTRMIESAELARKTYDVLTGRANAIVSTLIAGIFGGLRSAGTASRLGSAVFSAVTGDTATMALAASHNGLPTTKLLAGVVREIAADPDRRALAARLNLVAHATMDQGTTIRRYEDSIAGPAVTRWMASFVIRAQGMQAWTEGAKRAFTMEFLGHIADQAGKRFDELEPKFAGFLERHAITPAEWETLRAAPPLEVEGARFFDLDAASDKRAAEKLMGGVLDERAFAVLEPDARIQALTTAGLARGTFWGEMIRSAFQFKSFAMTMIATHMMRVATQGPIDSRIWRGSAFVLAHMMAGAAAIEGKQIIAGKDPQDMGDVGFWMRALAQGGGLGLYGDLLNSAVSRSGRSFIGDLAGPVPGMAEDVSKLVSKKARAMYEGETVSTGAELARFVRTNTPGSNLWFARAALDRLLFDQVQMLLDPEYRQSFRRMEKRARDDYGQEFWWRPGESAPARGPSIGAAIGG